jgi:hypothetical protein
MRAIRAVESAQATYNSILDQIDQVIEIQRGLSELSEESFGSFSGILKDPRIEPSFIVPMIRHVPVMHKNAALYDRLLENFPQQPSSRASEVCDHKLVLVLRQQPPGEMLRAIVDEDIGTIRFLIASGKTNDLNRSIGNFDVTPMMLAIATGNPYVIRLLESSGASFHGCLRSAAAFWHTDIFDWLLLQDRDGFTSRDSLLLICVAANFFHGVKFCLKHSICHDIQKAILIAASASNHAMFRMLLHFPAASIDADVASAALISAIRKQDQNMIRFVWGFTGPRVSYSHDTLIVSAVGAAIRTMSLDIFEFVLHELNAYGVMPNDSVWWWSGLTQAVWNGLLGSNDPRFIRRILEFQTVVGRDALIRKAVHGNYPMLLDAIADQEIDFFRQNEQSLFPECVTVEMAQHLLDRGARPDVMGQKGASCLGTAIRTKNDELIAFLQGKGVRPVLGDPLPPDDDQV